MTTTITPAAGTAPSFLHLGPGAADLYGAIDMRRAFAAGLQEGVAGTTGGGYKVTAGAGMTVSVAASTGDGAYVRGDSIATQGLYYVPPHSAAITEAVATSHATLPRLDKVVLEILDAMHDGGASNVVRTRVLTGTATAGTTLDNGNDGAHGAPALPASALLLADVLVPAASASVLAGNIRDRRSYAAGALRRIPWTGGNKTTASGTLSDLDSTNLKPRIECTGVPLTIELFCATSHSVGGAMDILSFAVDSALIDGSAVTLWQDREDITATQPNYRYRSWSTVPTPGSHLISPQFAVVTGGTMTVYADATRPLVLSIREDVRANADNS